MILSQSQLEMLGPCSPGILSKHNEQLFFKFAMNRIVLQIRVAIATGGYKGVK